MKSRFLSSVAVVSGLVGLSGAAAAQNPPSRPVYQWTGCYVGAQTGGGWGHTHALTGGQYGTQDMSTDKDGWSLGAQVGCDWQVAPNFVLGLEGMAAWTDIRGASDPFFSNKNVFSAGTNWIASATARAGFNSAGWLFYAKAGPAWSDNDYRVVGSFGGTPFDDRGSDRKSGWTWGVGLEWAFAPNWSAKLEYNQYAFGRRSVELSDQLSPFTTVIEADDKIRTVMIGLNYRFATGRP